MQVKSGSAAGSVNAGAGEQLTLGWVARRMGLLVVILASGIGAACAIYAYAGDEPLAQAASPSDTTIVTGSPRS